MKINKEDEFYVYNLCILYYVFGIRHNVVFILNEVENYKPIKMSTNFTNTYILIQKCIHKITNAKEIILK